MKTYIDRANEVLVLNEDVGHYVAKYDGADPCSDKAFHGLLR